MVLGVEVDERMAMRARAHGFDVEVAAFEEWDPLERRFDIVVAAQTWHWIDKAVGTRRAAEVLRERGRIALLWNVERLPDVLNSAFAAIHDGVAGDDVPNPWRRSELDVYEQVFRMAEDALWSSGRFHLVERRRAGWRRAYSRDEWLRHVRTFGMAAMLGADRLAAMVAGMSNALDSVGGGFEAEEATVLITAERRIGA